MSYLNYLGLSASSVEGPLWKSKTIYIDGEKLYDVQIYSNHQPVQMQKDIDDILNVNKHKCQICNIHVPSCYVEDHLKSTKHVTFLKIANTAHTRIQNHMNYDTLHKDALKLDVKETYFCDSCAVIVKNEDREKHSNTNSHKNCVKNDTLLQHLAIIYAEPLNESKIEIEIIQAEDNKVYNAASNDETLSSCSSNTDYIHNNTKIISKTNNVNKAYAPDLAFVGEKKPKDSNKTTENKIQNQLTETKKELSTSKEFDLSAFKHYEQSTPKQPMPSTSKQPATSTPKQPMPSTSKQPEPSTPKQPIPSTSKQPEPSTPKQPMPSTCKQPEPSTSKVLKYEESLSDLTKYLNFARFQHNKVHVTPCSGDTVEMVAGNVERVRIPLRNFHGYFVCTGDSVICILCRGLISVEGKKHKWNDLHIKNVMLPLTKTHLRQISDTDVHCVLCNRVIPTATSGEHAASTEHNDNLLKYRATKQLSQNKEQINNFAAKAKQAKDCSAKLKQRKEFTKETKEVAVANCLRWDSKMLCCKLCQFKAESTEESVNQHVASEAHLDKLRVFLTHNGVLRMSSEAGWYWCGVCQVKMGVHLALHCASYQHKKMLAEFLIPKPLMSL